MAAAAGTLGSRVAVGAGSGVAVGAAVRVGVGAAGAGWQAAKMHDIASMPMIKYAAFMFTSASVIF